MIKQIILMFAEDIDMSSLDLGEYFDHGKSGHYSVSTCGDVVGVDWYPFSADVSLFDVLKRKLRDVGEDFPATTHYLLVSGDDNYCQRVVDHLKEEPGVRLTVLDNMHRVIERYPDAP